MRIPIGFTGTQIGMTPPQETMVRHLLASASEFHHGDCIGADAQAHAIANSLYVDVVLHPPLKNRKRAYCDALVTREPQSYLVRNHDIVAETKFLIATPKGYTEELHSGTWATVRYARRLQKPHLLIYPDGSVKGYNLTPELEGVLQP